MIDLAFALAVAGVAALQELRTRELPDWLTVGVAIVGPGVHTIAAGMDGARELGLFAAAAGSGLGAIACGVVPFLLLRKNAIARKDLMLFVALGTLLGPVIGFGTQLFALAAAFVASRFVGARARAREEVRPVAPAMLGGVFLAAVAVASSV
jgi:prepilin peptidase CpaA